MDRVTSILMTGVGGQGVILAGEVVAETLMQAGYDVKKSELHGMAQRGGNVNTHIRFGPKVYSPVIPDGEVDILMSFELLETMRFLDVLSNEPVILVNNQKIFPPSVILGEDRYPDNIPPLLSERYDGFELVEGFETAKQAGNVRALNIAFLGALSKHFDINTDLWHDAIVKKIPAKDVDINLEVFGIVREIRENRDATY